MFDERESISLFKRNPASTRSLPLPGIARFTHIRQIDQLQVDNLDPIFGVVMLCKSMYHTDRTGKRGRKSRAMQIDPTRKKTTDHADEITSIRDLSAPEDVDHDLL